MKLRIKGNSIRIRLSKSEVATLSDGLPLREITNFGSAQLVYMVTPVGSEKMSASFENNTVTMVVPLNYLAGWPSNTVVGFEETIEVGNDQPLRLLLEKDFKCLDVVEEDQADFFENPSKSC